MGAGYVRTPCAYPGCEKRYYTHRYCRRHFTHMTRNQIPLDTYVDQAPQRWTNDELMAEWDFMRGWVSFEDFGARVGIKQESWERAYYRAATKGDPRARRATNDPATWPDPTRWTAAYCDPNRAERDENRQRQRATA